MTAFELRLDVALQISQYPYTTHGRRDARESLAEGYGIRKVTYDALAIALEYPFPATAREAIHEHETAMQAEIVRCMRRPVLFEIFRRGCANHLRAADASGDHSRALGQRM